MSALPPVLGAIPVAELLEEVQRRYLLQCEVAERRRTAADTVREQFELLTRELARETARAERAEAELRARGGAA